MKRYTIGSVLTARGNRIWHVLRDGIKVIVCCGKRNAQKVARFYNEMQMAS